ncbi:class I SAM-dependent methyltransferase [Thiobacillus sp.]|uniref:class I SAM-dependent methyltransferase n=1 Tax=Thiobacillus sp. TaxID=924 RepID=UPI0011D7695D|nr:class I SAM-dependent methyltransferase [Thiobacillus sp.]TXH76317.1 MAG: class I SAM-dependent methyltransferase [Thiobacillus sp.]
MDIDDKLLIRQRYKDRLQQYGPGIRALASGTEERRAIRFDVLTEIGIGDGATVLDVGCGLADYFAHLTDRGINVRYTGIDIVPELIDSARVAHPELDLQVRDLQEEPFPDSSFDYVVCSQVFNLDLGGDKNEKLVEDMLRAMYRIASRGVAIDLLTSYVDFRQDQLHYYRPEEMFSYAKQLTRRVTLRHDYPLFEFCLYLYPNFQGWSDK